MKKLILLVGLLPSVAVAQTSTSALMGVGTPPAQASEIMKLNEEVAEIKAAGTSLPIDIAGTDVATFDSGGALLIDGSAGNPSFSFSADGDTGIYRVGANHIGVSLGGAISASFSASGLTMFNSDRILNSAGTTALPAYTFDADPDTGIYLSNPNTIAFSAGGALVTQMTASGLSTNGEYRNTLSGGALVLRSPDGSYSVCTVDNSDNFTCAAE